MKPELFLSVLFIASIFSSCSSNQKIKEQNHFSQEGTAVPDMHTSKIALDWNGVYKGILPCSNCEGIETRIVLRKDGTFERRMKYLGKDDHLNIEEGLFEWDKSGRKVILSFESGDQYYQVGENILFHLDEDGNRITGDLASKYRLIKNRVDINLEEKKWILVELGGKSFDKTDGVKQGYIEFSMETGHFSGNNTCNNFFGEYELLEGNRIALSKAGSTGMLCPENELEMEFNRVLEMVDNYSISDGVLSLNKAKMAPLAKFRILGE